MKLRLNYIYSFIALNFIFLVQYLTYQLIISKEFTYQGFLSKNNSNLVYLLLIVLVISSVYIALKPKLKLNKLLATTYLLFAFFPSLILFVHYDMRLDIIFFHLITLFIYSLDYKLKKNIPVKFLKIKSIYSLSLIIFLLVLPFFLTWGFNLNIDNFLLGAIYELRENQIEKNNIYTGYTYSWFSKILIPFMIIYGINYKKFMFTIIGILMSLYFFLIGGHKSVLFVLFISILFLIFKKISSYKIIIALTFILFLFPVFIFLIFGDVISLSLIVRRIFFTPALLDHYYFEFFNNNYLYYSNSIFSSFIDYPYSLKPSSLIGFEYFQNEYQSANNGIISEGFMNMGYIGVIFNLFILFFFKTILNTLKIYPEYYGIIVIFIFTLISSGMFVSLLTHGGFFLIAVFLTIDLKKQYKNE